MSQKPIILRCSIESLFPSQLVLNSRMAVVSPLELLISNSFHEAHRLLARHAPNLGPGFWIRFTAARICFFFSQPQPYSSFPLVAWWLVAWWFRGGVPRALQSQRFKSPNLSKPPIKGDLNIWGTRMQVSPQWWMSFKLPKPTGERPPQERRGLSQPEVQRDCHENLRHLALFQRASSSLKVTSKTK